MNIVFENKAAGRTSGGETIINETRPRSKTDLRPMPKTHDI
jgi:hypothetical protein